MRRSRTRSIVRRIWSLAAIYILAGCVTPARAQSPFTITVDGTDTGRTFDGIGAVSGGGATSRLLLEYPPAQRRDILDFLFKPKFGASFQHLKVEIGGDINSTEGTEPSFAHTRDEFSNPTAITFNRGYEWTIMEEAKSRNPAIKLSGLEWGAPGWIGTGDNDRAKFFSQDNIDYLVQFINGAHDYHNLDIDYLGIWNETPYDTQWIKDLKAAIDQNNANRGLATRVIGGDQPDDEWPIINDLQSDPALLQAVAVASTHYASFGDSSIYPPLAPFDSPPGAKTLGIPLWDTEDGPWPLGPWYGGWEGSKELARIYNRNYAVGRITSTLLWNLVTSYYDNLLYPGAGAMTANSPWSGHYQVDSGIWVTAHTTQFADSGWQYLDRACGLFLDDNGQVTGSHVALKSPNNSDYSIITETTQASGPTTVTFTVAGGLSTGPVHVWRTNATDSFLQLDDVAPDSTGSFTIALDPESIYSLTTTTGQTKGTAASDNPPSSAFPLPYQEDFESYNVGQTARYLSDQGGSFEVAAASLGQGNVLRQMDDQRGIEWYVYCLTPDPYTYLGSADWTDYQVSVSAYMGAASANPAYIAVLGRINSVPCSANHHPWPDAYELFVDQQGNWAIYRSMFRDPEQYDVQTLASGTLPSFDATTWHRYALAFQGATITGFVDDSMLGQVADSTYATGRAGFGCGWHNAEFDNLAVE
jgi:galactosylceramidase